MAAYLTLEDPNGNLYNFPQDFYITDESWDINKNIVNKYYASGGRNVADGFLNARVITVEGKLRADTLAAFETRKRQLMQALLKGGKLYISNDTINRYIVVNLPDASIGVNEGQRFQDVQINFVAEYPFWQDTSETESEHIVTGDDSLTINNTGSDFLVLPTIEVEADQGVDVPSVYMKNNSDGGMSFLYTNSNFVQDDILIINSNEGTVKLNNNNSIEFFDPARFLRLQPGNNTIEYEGAACTIRFLYRKVYL